MPTKVKLTSFFGIDIPFSDLLGCQLRESHRYFKNFYKVVNANLFPVALLSLSLTQNIEFQDYSIPQFRQLSKVFNQSNVSIFLPFLVGSPQQMPPFTRVVW